MRAKILFVCNNPDFFASQHMHLAEAARKAGHDVLIATPAFAGLDRVEAAGFEHHIVPIARGGLKPVRDVAAIFRLTRLYRAVRPDLVYHITLKPILYGTIAARIAKVPAVVNANTGLGFAFIDESGRTTAVRGLLEQIYRRAIRHPNRRDLFLNRDDRNHFLAARLAESASSQVLNGPGVDLHEHSVAPEPKGEPVVVLPARLLWHKGLAEFVEAARKVRERGYRARFALVGDVDPGNPATVDRATLHRWDREGVVEWWGYSTDMPGVYQKSHIVVLPSYREGLGKVLAEAGATSRPVIATNVPGCREIVRDGYNGLLVPARDSDALAIALCRLIGDRPLRLQLGAHGRREVELRFAEPLIAEQTLDVMHALLQPERAEHRTARLAEPRQPMRPAVPVRIPETTEVSVG